MILDFNYAYKKYNLNASGLIHIGGHYGNEVEKYRENNIKNIVFFEPLSSNFAVLQKNVENIKDNVIIHQVALGNGNRKVTMNISSNEAQSSSILTPKVHLTAHPEVSFNGTEEVEMKKLDDYNYKDYNMLVIDVQGYELEVLKGATNTLNHVDYIYCEVNRDEVYEGNARIEDIDEFLLKYGFERVETQWYYTQVWGDALYIKTKPKLKNNVSIICACKNRYEALKLSINSWLMFDEIKEIIIVDWSSDNPINDLLQLSNKIKIIRVDDKKYFNLSQPLNLAASFATSGYILKMDCDYLLNPYYSFFGNYEIDQNSFLSGNPIFKHHEGEFDEKNLNFHYMSIDELRDYTNSHIHYFKYLKGLLYVSRSNFNKLGGFDESIQTYGWEDGEILQRLEKLNLNHKKIYFDYSILHLPHPDRKRFENSQNYSIDRENEIKNFMKLECTEDELPWQVDYVLVNEITEENKRKLIQENKIYSDNQNYYIKPKTNWNLQEINDNYYVATEIKENQFVLSGFPSVYYVSLEESKDRRQILESQFLSYGIESNAIISRRYEESNDVIVGDYAHTLNDGTKGCCVSHLKAIKKWYEDTNDDYGFFCEDDLSLETVNYWDFTWEEFIESVPEDAECVQLFTIRDEYRTYELRERLWDDWGATAYIITRDYAKKIIATFIDGDTFKLHIPDKNIMPLIENILFSSVGKCYTIPLFVENTQFNSTFIGRDEDITDGHKTNHIRAKNAVLNYWKNKNKKERSLLEDLLIEYSLDTENPEHNFNLGVWYENEGHTAPALSYYLRCAERASESDVDLAYEALIRGSFCYEKQGTRDGSSRSLLFQAQAFRPDRPEAYFLLSVFAQKKEWWQDCYLNADLALKYCNFDCAPLRTSVKYPGKYGLLFQKAIGGWWWGKSDQSRSLIIDIINEYDLTEEEYNVMSENLKRMGVEISE